MDKWTLRGLVYILVSVALLGYEFLQPHPPRVFLVAMYSVVILIGLILVFFMEDDEGQSPTGV